MVFRSFDDKLNETSTILNDAAVQALWVSLQTQVNSNSEPGVTIIRLGRLRLWGGVLCGLNLGE